MKIQIIGDHIEVDGIRVATISKAAPASVRSDFKEFLRVDQYTRGYEAGYAHGVQSLAPVQAL